MEGTFLYFQRPSSFEIKELLAANIPECLWQAPSTLFKSLVLFGKPDPHDRALRLSSWESIFQLVQVLFPGQHPKAVAAQLYVQQVVEANGPALYIIDF